MASEYLKWKYRDVKPETHSTLTKSEARRNWWDYHKRPLLAGAVLALAAIWLIVDAVTQVRPDYQAAYVGQQPLSEEDAALWQERLAGLGRDLNGDGRVVIQLNQYPAAEGQDAMYAYAANVKLAADLSAFDSYIFLLEDPEAFEAEFGILEKDWFETSDGLWLARRSFSPRQDARYKEECSLLWESLQNGGL